MTHAANSNYCTLLLLTAIGLLANGCERQPGPVAIADKTVRVSGTLTFEGKPLEGFQVTFLSSRASRPAVGVTDANGKFELGTNEPGDGAPPGKHSIAVVWVGPQVEMEPGKEEIMDDLSQLPQPPIEIPQKYGNPETSGLEQDVPESGLEDVKIDLKSEPPQG